MPPMVCVVERPEWLSGKRWRLRGWAFDNIDPGTLMEQTRQTDDGQESIMVWAFVEWRDDWGVIEAQGYHWAFQEDCDCLTIATTDAEPSLVESDWFLFFGGTLPTYEPRECPDCFGFGDLVAAVTKKFGIESCESCEERRKRWNKAWPNVRLRKK